MSNHNDGLVLETQNLTKNFGGLVALDSVNIALKDREILGVIGPNGAGKTTFVNVVCGVYLPSSGRIVFQGKDVTSVPAHLKCRLGISRTFQLVYPLTDLNALQNIMVGAIFGRGLPVKKAKEAAFAVADFVGLARPERRVTELTALEVKKLEIARALAADPKVLFLDETMAGLSIEETNEMMETIRKIRSRGIAICVIEHVMRVIRELTDRVVVLNAGKVIAEGPYDEVAGNKKVIEAYLGEEL